MTVKADVGMKIKINDKSFKNRELYLNLDNLIREEKIQ